MCDNTSTHLNAANVFNLVCSRHIPPLRIRRVRLRHANSEILERCTTSMRPCSHNSTTTSWIYPFVSPYGLSMHLSMIGLKREISRNDVQCAHVPSSRDWNSSCVKGARKWGDGSSLAKSPLTSIGVEVEGASVSRDPFCYCWLFRVWKAAGRLSVSNQFIQPESVESCFAFYS